MFNLKIFQKKKKRTCERCCVCNKRVAKKEIALAEMKIYCQQHYKSRGQKPLGRPTWLREENYKNVNVVN